MSVQVVFDFESMGTGESAIILAMAMVAYSEKDVDTPLEELVKTKGGFWKYDVREQVAMGRTTTADTMEWWKKQDPAVIEAVLKPSEDDLSIKLMPDHIDDFCAKHGYDGNGFIWQRGNIDIMWHDNVMASLGVDVPDRSFKWYKVRDARTAIDLLSTENRKYGQIMRASGMQEKFDSQMPNFMAHHPLSDVAKDIFQFREVGLF